MHVFAPLDKVMKFLEDRGKMEQIEEKFHEVNTIRKLNDKSKLIHQEWVDELPGGKRDFALCQTRYNLADNAYVVVRHSINTEKIPETRDVVRGDYKSLFIAQKSTDKSTIVNYIIKVDLKENFDKSDKDIIHELEELKFKQC